MNAGEIYTQLLADGLPVRRDSVVTFTDGTWTAEYTQPLTDDQKALVLALPQRIGEADRITAIRLEANKRVDAITGGQVQVNQDMAMALARMYADLKAQGLLQITTVEALDPLFAKQGTAKAIRLHEAAMIQDPTLNWPE